MVRVQDIVVDDRAAGQFTHWQGGNDPGHLSLPCKNQERTGFDPEGLVPLGRLGSAKGMPACLPKCKFSLSGVALCGVRACGYWPVAGGAPNTVLSSSSSAVALLRERPSHCPAWPLSLLSLPLFHNKLSILLKLDRIFWIVILLPPEMLTRWLFFASAFHRPPCFHPERRSLSPRPK